jgi:hypothetical protein
LHGSPPEWLAAAQRTQDPAIERGLGAMGPTTAVLRKSQSMVPL